MNKKVIIVGGVAGGATSAARLRRLDENLEIVMFEKGEYVSFANCGLPYHIGEVIPQRESLLVTTKEALYNRFRIDVRNNSEITNVDFNNKEVTVLSKEKGEYKEKYDYLILSPGAKPVKPPIEGIDNNKILSLRNVPDTDKIKAIVDSGIKEAVVIGGGFIGIEVCENLKERGIDVTLIENAPHILASLDSEISMICEKEMRDKGVKLILNDGVSKFIDNNETVITVTNSGKKIEAPLVVLAIGVTPDTEFLKNSSLDLNERGYIKTNSHMMTNIENVYAAGDAVETIDYVTNDMATIALAGPANRQGRIIADNICGINREYKGSLGTSIIKIFDLTAASTGNNERQLQKKNIEYRTFIAHPQSHAAYYPNAKQMTVKLITDLDGKVLGSQAVGYDGVDKFIDVIATAIKFDANVDDLAELDLAYAPPYLSAKSPANIVAFVAQNTFDNLVEVKTFNDYNKEFNKEKDVLLDVREVEEVLNGAIDGQVNIPLNSLRDRLSELDKEKSYWVYCQIGLRGYIGSRILSQNGFKAYNLTGGYRLLSLGKVNKEKVVSNETNVQKDIHNSNSPIETINVDACGLSCPGPLLKVKEGMDNLKEGQILNITASNPGFMEDIKAFARRTDAELINVENSKGIIKASLKKN